MGAPNIQQQLYLAKALNENTDEMFDHPEQLDESYTMRTQYGRSAKMTPEQRAEAKAKGDAHVAQMSKTHTWVKGSGKNGGRWVPKQETNEEEMNEAVTRKHFQQVADLIKAHPDPKKRAELAAHHAEIFKKQNPRFDHERFFKAANAEKPINEEEIGEESISEWLLRKIELAEGSRGKRRLERIRGTPGVDNQARDRAAISDERRRAGLSPRIPKSSVQAAMLKKTKKGKTVFGVSSEPYAIDSLGNPVPKGTKPYRAAARVPKAVLKRREEAKIKEMKGKYKKANP